MADSYSTNREAWDRLVAQQSRFCRVATDEECRQPLKTLDSRGWLPQSVEGLNVLCLAAGGGWQSILYASAGARVTVIDISPGMLALDVREAKKRGLNVAVHEASMDDLSFLHEASFDIVHHPVSTCYIPDVVKVYTQIAYVLKNGGHYISQHKQPTSLQISHRDAKNQYVIGVEYYHNGPLPVVADDSYREPHAREYLHRWEDLVGGLCRTGFLIKDLREPKRGVPNSKPEDFRHRGMFTPPYVRMLAQRLPRIDESIEAETSTLWLPH
jgi:ubiquinone/menaquinone biosynthesis C-methylase UbiE